MSMRTPVLVSRTALTLPMVAVASPFMIASVSVASMLYTVRVLSLHVTGRVPRVSCATILVMVFSVPNVSRTGREPRQYSATGLPAVILPRVLDDTRLKFVLRVSHPYMLVEGSPDKDASSPTV